MSNRIVEDVLDVLQTAGYERLPRPLVVAGTTFDFEAAARGTGVSHDLVVVATSATAPNRLLRLLSALSRMLDQVASSRPVTLILVGETPDELTVADLEQHARILVVASTEATHEEVREAVAILLPLELPSHPAAATSPLAAVADILGPPVPAEQQAFLEAAVLGADAVRDALRRYIDDATLAGAADGFEP